MSCTRKEFVAQMQAWVGLKESDGSHKKIIDIYNTIKPLPVGYKLKDTDAWCAGTVSAAAQVLNATDIIPCECSCPRMITLAQKMGIWVEADNYVPLPGDIPMYDWDDSGSGDNRGGADHVGVVEKVSGNTMTVIEGNYSNAVKRRTLEVNGRYIRGYIVPEFDADSAVEDKPEVKDKPVARELFSMQLETLKKGCKGNVVKAIQILLAGNDCKCGSSGADGDFGPATDGALKKFQIKKNLEVDGICGPATWAALLGMK